MKELQAGVYQHYKRKFYLVLGYGHDANQEGREVVIYVGLQLSEAQKGPRLSVRTVEDFTRSICWFYKSEACRYFDEHPGDTYGFGFHEENYHRPRFVYISPDWQGKESGWG